MSISERHVSRQAKDRVAGYLSAKLAILRLWSRSGVPCRPGDATSLEWYPRSLRQFCAWSEASTSIPQPGVGPFAFQSLQAHPDEKAEAVQLLRAVERVAEKCRQAVDPKGRIRSLEAKVALEREKRAGALLGYRKARQGLHVVATQLAQEKRAHEQTILVLTARATAAEVANAEAQARVAALTKTLAKVAPLRQAK